MKSPWIEALRSVSLTVPDLAAAEVFYTHVWRLDVTARARGPQGEGVIYLGGSGADHHLLSLHEAPGTPCIRLVTLRARSLEALQAVAQAVQNMAQTMAQGQAGAHVDGQVGGQVGGRAVAGPAATAAVEQTLGPASDPAGGQRIVVRDADGRRFEVVHGDVQRPPVQPPPADQPQRLAHAVLNSHDLPSAQAFLEQALGFVLSDRTRIMAFMNCNADHHSLALGITDNDALNHIAFVMPTLDAVMRGGGRMKDAGHAIEWGPGRHGPGHNAFNYFIDPFGIVIEYTADVAQIDDSYRVGSPADWTWPPGRVDQWGLGVGPTATLKEAQRAVRFVAQLDALQGATTTQTP